MRCLEYCSSDPGRAPCDEAFGALPGHRPGAARHSTHPNPARHSVFCHSIVACRGVSEARLGARHGGLPEGMVSIVVVLDICWCV